MRLLFDANLAPSLVGRLSDLHPGSRHVEDLVSGLESSDSSIWEVARRDRLAIVTKDSDFHQRALFFGPPPKVIWVRLGNCSTTRVEQLLRQRALVIANFCEDPLESVLVIP